MNVKLHVHNLMFCFLLHDHMGFANCHFYHPYFRPKQQNGKPTSRSSSGGILKKVTANDQIQTPPLNGTFQELQNYTKSQDENSKVYSPESDDMLPCIDRKNAYGSLRGEAREGEHTEVPCQEEVWNKLAAVENDNINAGNEGVAVGQLLAMGHTSDMLSAAFGVLQQMASTSQPDYDPGPFIGSPMIQRKEEVVEYGNIPEDLEGLQEGVSLNESLEKLKEDSDIGDCNPESEGTIPDQYEANPPTVVTQTIEPCYDQPEEIPSSDLADLGAYDNVEELDTGSESPPTGVHAVVSGQPLDEAHFDAINRGEKDSAESVPADFAENEHNDIAALKQDDEGIAMDPLTQQGSGVSNLLPAKPNTVSYDEKADDVVDPDVQNTIPETVDELASLSLDTPDNTPTEDISIIAELGGPRLESVASRLEQAAKMIKDTSDVASDVDNPQESNKTDCVENGTAGKGFSFRSVQSTAF